MTIGSLVLADCWQLEMEARRRRQRLSELLGGMALGWVRPERKEVPMQAYCMKCKTRREIKEPTPATLRK